MKYTSKTFTLPAAPSKISQAEWDRIFKPEPKKDKKRQEKSK